MNRLRSSLNVRKGFVYPAMAVLWLVMVGGSNALANTVWRVSKASSNATCTMTATTCNTINSAVSAASEFDVIMVGAGKYNESVIIETQNLTILGAQAGKDPRTATLLTYFGALSEGNDVFSARTDPTKEAIVDASGLGSGPGNGAGFDIEADNVVVDGFTIQGGTAGTNASGIYVDAYTPEIVNNIIQNNAVGIYLYDQDYGTVTHNVIMNNNTGKAGSNDEYVVGLAGFGIASYDFYPVSIIENSFQGNLAAAMYWYELSGSEISQNTSNYDGAFVVLNSSDSLYISRNQGRNFGAKGFLPLPGADHADAAIDLVYEGSSTEITSNDLEQGSAANYNGIAFSTLPLNGTAPDYVCEECVVSNNRIIGFAGNGIVAEASTVGRTLDESLISGNLVENNGGVGILIGLASENYYNTVINNKALYNHVNDCEDDTVGPGSGSPSTYNTWVHNAGNLSLPHGLCAGD